MENSSDGYDEVLSEKGLLQRTVKFFRLVGFIIGIVYSKAKDIEQTAAILFIFKGRIFGEDFFEVCAFEVIKNYLIMAR